jgi:hypothetical protein
MQAAEVAAPTAALTDEAKAMRKWLEESDWMDAYRQEAEQEAAAATAEPVAAAAAGRDSVEALRAKVPLDELLAADSALLEGLLAAYREANAQVHKHASARSTRPTLLLPCVRCNANENACIRPSWREQYSALPT